MKKIINVFLVFSLLILVYPNFEVQAKNNKLEKKVSKELKGISYSDFELKNNELKNIYKDLLKQEKYNKKNFDTKMADLEMFDEESRDLLMSSFNHLINYADGDHDISEVYEFNNEEVYVSIVYDRTENLLILSQFNSEKNQVLVSIGEEKYIIHSSDENILITSQEGYTVPISILESSEQIQGVNYAYNNQYRYEVPGPALRSATYNLVAGPFLRTTSRWAEVLGALGAAWGVMSKYVVATTLVPGFVDDIIIWASVVLAVGAFAWVKTYDKVYQYNASDCTSYFKDSIYVHSYHSESAGYVDFQKHYYRYFHSTNPQYAGQNCMAY